MAKFKILKLKFNTRNFLNPIPLESNLSKLHSNSYLEGYRGRNMMEVGLYLVLYIA